jgi:uncharacterized protein (DUF2249 family)
MRRLDLRHLPAPEPFVLAMEAADALQMGETIEVLTPLLPHPLLQALEVRGLHYDAAQCDEGGARILITRVM